MPFPIELKYIEDAEQQLGVEFPKDFKIKMQKMNGGHLELDEDEWDLIPFFDKSDKKRISRTSNHIVVETQKMREWPDFPLNAIAIAQNGSGDYLILMPDNSEPSKMNEGIYLWLHETGKICLVNSNINNLK